MLYTTKSGSNTMTPSQAFWSTNYKDHALQSVVFNSDSQTGLRLLQNVPVLACEHTCLSEWLAVLVLDLARPANSLSAQHTHSTPDYMMVTGQSSVKPTHLSGLLQGVTASNDLPGLIKLKGNHRQGEIT